MDRAKKNDTNTIEQDYFKFFKSEFVEKIDSEVGNDFSGKCTIYCCLRQENQYVACCSMFRIDNYYFK